MYEEFLLFSPCKIQRITRFNHKMVQKFKSVLIVDDSETNLVLLEAILENEGWMVKTTKSATLGMEIIKDDKPDLILLDLLMPGIDGYEMLESLKSGERYKDIPVIIVSAVSDNTTRKTCLEKGAEDYISKSVDMEQLLKRVQDVLKSHRKTEGTGTNFFLKPSFALSFNKGLFL